MRLGGLQGRPGRVWKIAPPLAFDSRTVQSIASHSNNWATQPMLPMGFLKIWYFVHARQIFQVFNWNNMKWHGWTMLLNWTCRFAEWPKLIFNPMALSYHSSVHFTLLEKMHTPGRVSQLNSILVFPSSHLFVGRGEEVKIICLWKLLHWSMNCCHFTVYRPIIFNVTFTGLEWISKLWHSTDKNGI
jgi:hypothetical protein